MLVSLLVRMTALFRHARRFPTWTDRQPTTHRLRNKTVAFYHDRGAHTCGRPPNTYRLGSSLNDRHLLRLTPPQRSFYYCLFVWVSPFLFLYFTHLSVSKNNSLRYLRSPILQVTLLLSSLQNPKFLHHGRYLRGGRLLGLWRRSQ